MAWSKLIVLMRKIRVSDRVEESCKKLAQNCSRNKCILILFFIRKLETTEFELAQTLPLFLRILLLSKTCQAYKLYKTSRFKLET